MKFFSGEVLHHKLIGTVVVAYWDEVCRLDKKSIMLMTLINKRLKYGFAQPFYRVIKKDDGRVKYVAEEDLSRDVQEEVDGHK